MANYLGMVKVSAYRLKYIHLQIYNFHLEEATFLSKSLGLTIAVKEDFLILQTRKCIKFPVPMINPHDTKSVPFYDFIMTEELLLFIQKQPYLRVLIPKIFF